MATSDRINYLLQGYAESTLTAQELNELKASLNDPDTDRQAKEYLLQVLQQTPPLETHSEARLNALLQKVRDVEPVPVRRMQVSRRWWWAAAAIVIITAGTAILLSQGNKEKQSLVTTPIDPAIVPGGNKALLTLADGTIITLDSAANGVLAQQGNASIVKLHNGQIAYNVTGSRNDNVMMNVMRTPRGGQYKVVLPDGTAVWLNASSSITYPTVFTGNERRVTVTGEVYFEVAKNARMPFKVNVNDQSEIEVLGTHFNVNAYDDEETIKTTLLEGSVRMKSGSNEIVLKPGEQAVLTYNLPLTTYNNIDIDQVMAWKNGFFNFEQADIRTVMRQIARWYDVEVAYEGTIPADKLVGELPMDASIEQVLKALQRIQVHFRMEGRKIIVMP